MEKFKRFTELRDYYIKQMDNSLTRRMKFYGINFKLMDYVEICKTYSFDDAMLKVSEDLFRRSRGTASPEFIFDVFKNVRRHIAQAGDKNYKRLYLSEEADLMQFAKQKFDPSVFENLEQEFCIEYTFEDKVEGTVMTRVDVYYDKEVGVLFFFNFATDKNKPGKFDINKMNIFNQYPILYDKRGERLCVAKRTESYDGYEFSMTIKGDTFYGSCLDLKDIKIENIDVVDSSGIVDKDENPIATSAGAMFVACGVLKEYFKVMNNVTVVKKESTAVKRAESHTDKGIKVHEPSVGPTTRYIPLSSYAVKVVREKKPHQGGHHKSPHPHPVDGFERHYKSGKTVWIDGFYKPCENWEGHKNNDGGNETIVVVNK